jgi:cell division control protein 6
MLGIVSVTERNEGRRGGTYREYALDMEVDLLLDAMAETVREVGIHQSVREFVVPEDLETVDADLGDFATES